MSSILLLHGALGSKQHFDQLKTELGKSMTVYTLNFEGHGGIPSDRPFSISNFAENVLDFVNENDLKGINVFGYSMGGYVALSLASKHPDLFGKIITLGTKFNWTPESAAKEVKMLNPEVIEEKVPKFAESLKALHAPNDWKTVLRKTADMMLDLGNGAGLSKEDFESINIDVLLARGTEDVMVAEDETVLVSNLISNSKYLELSGVVHPIERIDPKVIYQLITENIN